MISIDQIDMKVKAWSLLMKECMEFLIHVYQLPTVNRLYKKEKEVYSKEEKIWSKQKQEVDKINKEVKVKYQKQMQALKQ